MDLLEFTALLSGRAIPLKHGSCMRSSKRSIGDSAVLSTRFYLSLDKSVFGLYPGPLCKTKGIDRTATQKPSGMADGISERKGNFI